MLLEDMLGSKMSTFGPKFGVLDWPVQPGGGPPVLLEEGEGEGLPVPLPVNTPNSQSE
jgi:hypothetical protein